jgi:hypothetical protein
LLKTSHPPRSSKSTFRNLIVAGPLRRALFKGLVGLVAFGLVLASVLTSDGNAQENLKTRETAVAENADKSFSGLKALNSERQMQTGLGQLIDTGLQDPDLARALRDYDLVKLNPRVAAAEIRATGKLSLRTRKGNFDMQLVPHDLRATDYVAQVITAHGVALKLPRTTVNTYKGLVDGSPNAQVRMTVKEDSFEGVIIRKGEHYFIQPARSLSKNAKEDEFVFYKGSDVTGDAEACGVTLADEVAERAAAALRGDTQLATGELAFNGQVTGLSPMKIVRLATDADAEYVALLGGASQANSQIVSIMNLVDGIYQVETGISFQIVFQNTWTNSGTDPYSSTAPSTLLGQFRNHWNANFTQITRSLVHLWTGKNLDEGVIGIASLAVVCRNPERAYGLSQRFPIDASNPVTAQTVVLTAHEIGHNFGASHTDDPEDFNADIEQPCDKTIMERFIRNGSNFCTFSRSQIMGQATGYGSCLLESSIPAPSPSCTETPITKDLDTPGTISNSDCHAPSRGVRYLADRYSFNATAGQQVVITMNRTSGLFNPYLYLIGPDGHVIYQSDSESQPSTRIPISDNFFTLPLTGKYIVETTTSVVQQTGDYTVKVAFNGCTLSANATQSFPAAGGIGTINVTPSGPCSGYMLTTYPHLQTTQWIMRHEGGGSGPRSINFTVDPNTAAAGRMAFILVEPSSPNFSFGGIKLLITQSGTGPDCSLTPIAPGQTVNGDLSTNDCQSPVRGNGFYTDRFSFTAVAGQQVAITVSSNNAPTTDTFLTLLGPNGAVILTDDDSGGLTNSRLPGGTGLLTLGLPGTYLIEVGTFESGGTGPYSLNLVASIPNTLQFPQSAYNVAENGERVSLTITRADTSGAATVAYVTSDTAGLTNCNVVNVVASSRCDYAASVGTIYFAAGEGSKSFSIPLVDDSYAESLESFTISLSSATGSSLGAQAIATISIADNDAATGPNPIDQTAFFVRQHYIDFLGREPDPAGFTAWQNTINNCPGGDTTCDRVHVSGNFFQSAEFQQRGYFVYRFYPVAFGRKPDYAEFIPDLARVSGFLSDAQLEAAKVAFINDFMNRPAFAAAYNGLSNTQYVDTLLARAGVTSPNRDFWIAALGNGTRTRATVLRDISESLEVYNKYYNEAFVVMQYFGYLRRDPDASYLNWIQELDTTGNSRNMINGFVNSLEYRFRFGP